MKAYKLEEVVRNKAREKGISLYGSHNDLLRDIKKGMESGELTSEEQIIEKLKTHKDFRLNLGREDFEEIIKNLD